MSKKILQDVVKIKNIKKVEDNPEKVSYSDIRKDVDTSRNSLRIKEKKNVSNNMLWFVALISVIFLFFAVSYLFSSATVTVNPKTKDFVLDKTLVATKNTNTGGLSFNLVILSGEESKEVSGGEEKDYLESATGKVLIYNAFSSSPQALSIDTRLEGSNGKIYKTKSKVIVPGMIDKDTPGKIGVDIYGAEAGEEYNSAPLDFKIFGFKGTSKYSKFYARSVGEIKGGLKGKARRVSVEEKEKVIKELKDNLFAKLFQKAKDQTPKDFMLLKDATFLKIDEENETSTDTGGNITMTIKGTFNGILFNKEKLEKEIINASLDKNDTSSVYVANIEDLTFSKTDNELVELDDFEDITFNLSGTPKIVWKIDEDKLMEDLLGKNKKDFNQILSQYTNIDSANLSIRPVWKSSIPSKNKDIEIIVNY